MRPWMFVGLGALVLSPHLSTKICTDIKVLKSAIIIPFCFLPNTTKGWKKKFGEMKIYHLSGKFLSRGDMLQNGNPYRCKVHLWSWTYEAWGYVRSGIDASYLQMWEYKWHMNIILRQITDVNGASEDEVIYCSLLCVEDFSVQQFEF